MKIKRLRKRKSGQAVIEFIFVLGLYFCLIGFMFTGFQVMHSKMIMNISAYNGARYASLYKGNTGTAKKQAEDVLRLNAFKGTDKANVSIARKGDYVTCTVKNNVKLLFPMIDPNNPIKPLSSKYLETSFTMRVEK